jgi:DNA-binding NtrC family response regulator
MKILLADDDKNFCLALKKYLQKEKTYQVSLAFDGDEAKHCVERDTYDIIFLDCNMPFISGIDLIKIVKNENPEAKIIMISGYEDIDQNFAKTCGIDEFLKKPFSIKEIDRILHKYGRKK